MDQATFDFSTLSNAARQATAADATAFEIGWDHAQRGLVPPPGLLLPGSPVAQGWSAGRAVFGARTLASTPAARQWLALRLQAWREGVAFETQALTPNVLAQLQTTHCPVRRTPLGAAPAAPDAPAWLRLDPRGGYAAGHLVMLSRAAAAVAGLHQGMDALACVRQASQLKPEAIADGLDTAAWLRLGVLRSFVTPLPFHRAAALPMVVLPPNRVRLLNAAQGLQALVTMIFARPGWAARARQWAHMLPAHTLRLDFNLFVGAMAPRVLAAGLGGLAGAAGVAQDATATAAGRLPRALRHALEDAWTHERVQRRWQHFVLSLGESATETLLDRAAAAGLAGVRTMSHEGSQATESWGLPAASGGVLQRVQPTARSATPADLTAAASPRGPLQPGWRAAPARRRHDRPSA